MKRILKITYAIVLTALLFACSKEQEAEQISLIDNTQNISKIINSFDVTLKKAIINPKLKKEELGNIFINEARNNGLKINKFDENKFLVKNNNTLFSKGYTNFAIRLSQTGNYLTKEDYINDLAKLRNEVVVSDISIEEKQLLVDSMGLMTAFSDWMSTLKSPYASKTAYVSCDDGWWSCWGKCVAGTLGGAVSGAFGGCVGAGGVGALIGSLAGGFPGSLAGFVAGCFVGEIVGGISGALIGAAASC